MATLFVSHSSRDGAAIAQSLAAALEAAGYRCWIAPRDVKPGTPYPGQIVAAIRECDGLVLIVTPAANESPDVLQEVQLAGQSRKTIAPVVVNGATPSDDLHYYLGVRHQIPWSDAQKTTAELLRAFPSTTAGAPNRPIVAAGSEGLGNFMSEAAGERFEVVIVTPGFSSARATMVIADHTGMSHVDAHTLLQGFPPICVARNLPRAKAKALWDALQATGAIMLPLDATRKR